MGKKKIQYTREFTKQAIELCEQFPERPIAEIARDLGVQYGTLYNWMDKAGKTKQRVSRPPKIAASPQTPVAMKLEIERLQRELEETRKQLDFAKKAAAFFAQQSK
jgi:transposase